MGLSHLSPTCRSCSRSCMRTERLDSILQKACNKYEFVLMCISYLITKACEVGRGTASAFDPKLTASSNFSPYEFVYVCSIQASISLAEHATCYARSVCGAIKTQARVLLVPLRGTSTVLPAPPPVFFQYRPAVVILSCPWLCTALKPAI